jgi:hypothetical protein
VPAGCVASESPGENRRAFGQMRRALEADVRPSTELDLAVLLERARG